MATTSQRKASASHRRRAAARGLVRVEVQASTADAGLIRAFAARLRSDPAEAEAIRTSLRDALGGSQAGTVLDMFRSDLPDDVFDGVFDQPRDRTSREIDI